MARAQQSRTLYWQIWLAPLLAVIFLYSGMSAQSGTSQNQAQQATQARADQDIPDAPSVVQPPAPKPILPPSSSIPKTGQPDEAPGQSSSQPTSSQAAQQSNQTASPGKQATQPPPPMPPVKTVAPGSIPRNQLNPKENLYTIRQLVNFVLIPVMVKDREGRRVDGLLSTDFSVLENGKKQQLTFFTSDPFQLSVAIVIDLGMPDVVLQKLHQTYPALVGAFSPYDEYALYTYSSTVSQVMDFTRRSERLTATLDEIKMVHGASNGPPVLNDPFSVGPTVNGVPVGGPPIEPVQTPRRESHVLNDAILRAGVDLAKRERGRRKVILIVSNGREMGSQASYREVLRLLESRDIQVKAIVLDTGALPFYKQAERRPQWLRIPAQGYGDILPKYTGATGGGQIMTELTRYSIEQAFSEITSEARNQYTLGYPTQATVSAACRSLEVIVDKRNLKIAAKDKYCPAPAPR